MTGQEAIAYIHSYNWEKHTPGLCRIRELMEKLGNPQKDLKFIHVAGTNGKGSTCAMLDSVLREAGYRVGLNTSPYIMTFHERIRVNGEMISDEALVDLVERVQPVAEAMAEHPTEFELITAIAMLYFREQQCDIVGIIGKIGQIHRIALSDCHGFSRKGVLFENFNVVLHQLHRINRKALLRQCMAVPSCCRADFQNPHPGFQIPFHVSHRGQKFHHAMFGAKTTVFIVLLVVMFQILFDFHCIFLLLK
jgi:hypothetical protein